MYPPRQAWDLPSTAPAAPAPSCASCKSQDAPAVAHCFSCPSLLCANCVIAHQLMIAFEGHKVTSLGQHPALERESSGEGLASLLIETKRRLVDLQKTSKTIDSTSSRLIRQYEKAMGDVAETHNFYISMLAQ